MVFSTIFLRLHIFSCMHIYSCIVWHKRNVSIELELIFMSKVNILSLSGSSLCSFFKKREGLWDLEWSIYYEVLRIQKSFQNIRKIFVECMKKCHEKFNKSRLQQFWLPLQIFRLVFHRVDRFKRLQNTSKQVKCLS